MAVIKVAVYIWNLNVRLEKVLFFFICVSLLKVTEFNMFAYVAVFFFYFSSASVTVLW